MLNELDMALMESLDKEDTLDMVEDAQMDEVFDEVAENDPHETIDALFPEI